MCEITQGYSLPCQEGNGGIKRLAFARFATATTFALDASGRISGITGLPVSGVVYQQEKETAVVVETTNKNIQNGSRFEAGSLTAVVNTMTAANRAGVEQLLRARMHVIAVDENNRYWLLGQTRGCDVTGGESGTGTALGDRNGYSLEITWQEPVKCREVTATAAAQFAAI